MVGSSPDASSALAVDAGVLLAAVALCMVLDPSRFVDRLVFGATSGLLIFAYAAWRIGWTMQPFEGDLASHWDFTNPDEQPGLGAQLVRMMRALK